MVGKKLKFISKINRDGSGVVNLYKVDMSAHDFENFAMNSLSLNNKTWIACGFNSYVVKIK